jgi:hypothetical protein
MPRFIWLAKIHRRNIATGKTPARQAYHYPREFTRARSHEHLMKEFEAAEATPASRLAPSVYEYNLIVTALWWSPSGKRTPRETKSGKIYIFIIN